MQDRFNTATERVYTLEDLRAGQIFAPASLAVLGSPIKQTFSPRMHNAALAKLAQSDPRFHDWRYYKLEIPAADFSEALALLRKLGFRGVNLGTPLKVLGAAHVARIDPLARRMGAVNTLKLEPDGYVGYNTDGWGLEHGTKEDFGRSLSEFNVVILGAGGASRAAAVTSLACGCRSLWVGNRDPQRLCQLIDTLRSDAAFCSDKVHSFDLSKPLYGVPSPALIINATTQGIHPEDGVPCVLEPFAQNTGISDMIYNPAETPLMRAAKARGMTARNGVSMLVWQGMRALEIWTAKKATSEVVAAAKAALPMA